MAYRNGKGSSTKTCFVICPIGDDGSAIRQWSDDVLDYIISPIVENAGYEKPIRADQISEPGIITSQIVEKLIESDLVIADLSFGNPNVLYELAVRHVTKKPCIHMIKIGEKNPFDTSSNRAIVFDANLRGADNARKKLEKQIESIKDGKNEVDNPIGNALTLKNLKSSGDSSQIMLADIMEAIANIGAEVRSQRYNYQSQDFVDKTAAYKSRNEFGVTRFEDLDEKTRRQIKISNAIKLLVNLSVEENHAKKAISISKSKHNQLMRNQLKNELYILGMSDSDIDDAVSRYLSDHFGTR